MRENTTLIFGKSYTGKTVRMFWQLREEDRVLVADPKCSQLVKLSGWRHFWPRYLLEANAWADSADLLNYLRERRERRRIRCIVHFRSFYKQNLALLCALAMAVKDLVLAVDELALFAPPGPPDMLPASTTALVVSGTHDRVRFISTAQRPCAVHNTPRAIVEHMMIYRVTEPNDLKMLAAYLPAELVDALPGLPDQVCIDWTDFRPAFIDRTLVGRLGELLPAER